MKKLNRNYVEHHCLYFLIYSLTPKMFLGQIFLEKVINDFKDKGYNFNHNTEMHIITIANKLDMSYDFFIKHNMHAVEWKLNASINKNKNLINNFDRNWRHLLNRKSESYRV